MRKCVEGGRDLERKRNEECWTTKEGERAVERPFYISSARLRRRQCRGFPQLHSAANFRSLHPPLFLLPTPTYTSYPTIRSTLISFSSSSDLQPFHRGPSQEGVEALLQLLLNLMRLFPFAITTNVCNCQL